MAACFDRLFCRSGSARPPLQHGTWQLPPPLKGAAAVTHSACGDALAMNVQRKQGIDRIKGEGNRMGGVVFAGKDGGEGLRKDDGVVSGTGLVFFSRIDQPKDAMEGSIPDQALHTKFIKELSERVEMLFCNETGKSVEDYKRRAEFFHRISEIFVAHRNLDDQSTESDTSGDPNRSSDNAARKNEILFRGKNFVADEMDEVLILEDLLMERDEGTGANDYNRRAAIFGWSAELVAAKKRQDQTSQDSFQREREIRHFEDVLVLQKDTGRAASDYSRRAATFGKNAELFVAASHKQAEKKRAAQERVNSSSSQ